MNYWALGCFIVSLIWCAYHCAMSIIKDDDKHTTDMAVWGFSLVVSMMLLY